ncbi:hypothetical protein GTO36_06275 [bacterium]|nr:hypothetical protein [bacterium]
MLIITFIISIIALIISILAYQRTGGAEELRKTVDGLSSTMESLKERVGGSFKEQIEHLTSATESLRDKTADTIGKLEATVRRRREEKKPPEVKPPKRPEELKKRLPPTAKDFQSELDSIFASAQQEGKSFIEVKSGDLHRSVGGYPGPNHRMPLCCGVMKRNMKPGDQILQQPPSGEGATLIIRFELPR